MVSRCSSPNLDTASQLSDSPAQSEISPRQSLSECFGSAFLAGGTVVKALGPAKDGDCGLDAGGLCKHVY